MIYRISSKLERIFAKFQGKGWAGTTVNQEVSRVAKLADNPKLAIDIGANIGDYTAELITKFKDIEVHLFEPSNTNYLKLIERFRDNNNLIINKLAVSDSNGSLDLFSNAPGSALASLTKRRLDHFGLEFNFKEKVETIKFEDYWKSNLSMRPIDIIKIDVEGHELDVLKGLGESILQTKFVQFEFGGTNIDTKTYFQDYWYYFKEHAFKIYRITPFGLNPILYYSEFDESFSISNFLCINKNVV